MQACALLLLVLATTWAHAQESVCARVKIEIKQELTLERQAFDAEMRITNSLPVTPLTQVEVEVRVADETGAGKPRPMGRLPQFLLQLVHANQLPRAIHTEHRAVVRLIYDFA